MRLFKPLLVLVAVLGMATPLLGQTQSQHNYTLQDIISAADINYLEYLQNVTGFKLSNYADTGRVQVSFNDVKLTGVHNYNLGLGSFRNQGSVAYLNIQPNLEILPMLVRGRSVLQRNQGTIQNFNYAVDLSFNGFKGSGLVLLDVMAGSLSNQFTSLTFSMGRNAIPTPKPANDSLLSSRAGNPGVVSLSNDQLQLISATAGNDIQLQGKQQAVVNIEGAPNIQGVSAMTISSGIGNTVQHNVSVNIDTAK